MVMIVNGRLFNTVGTRMSQRSNVSFYHYSTSNADQYIQSMNDIDLNAGFYSFINGNSKLMV